MGACYVVFEQCFHLYYFMRERWSECSKITLDLHSTNYFYKQTWNFQRKKTNANDEDIRALDNLRSSKKSYYTQLVELVLAMQWDLSRERKEEEKTYRNREVRWRWYTHNAYHQNKRRRNRRRSSIAYLRTCAHACICTVWCSAHFRAPSIQKERELCAHRRKNRKNGKKYKIISSSVSKLSAS